MVISYCHIFFFIYSFGVQLLLMHWLEQSKGWFLHDWNLCLPRHDVEVFHA